MSTATKDKGNKIVISPVTRVEGHGKVTIRMDEKGKVDYARFHIVEFRGFERFARASNWSSKATRSSPKAACGA